MSRLDVLQRKTTEYNKPDTTYRKLSGLNCSSIKLYDQDPLRFYNEYILGQKDEEEPKSYSLIVGDLVDFYLLTCHMDEQEFDQRLGEQFAVTTVNKTTAQAFCLADELFKIYRNCERENIEFVFSSAFEEALEIVKNGTKPMYKGKTLQQALEDFNKTGKLYFDECIANRGKTVIGPIMVDKAKKIVNQLRTDEYHGDFINQQSDKDVEVIKKLAWQFNFMDLECKGEVDFLHILNLDKKIYYRDLKTSFDAEDFEYSYLKYRYYLQNAFYYLLVKDFAKKHGLGDYEIVGCDFLVLDTSKSCRRPLLYRSDKSHREGGLFGFTARGQIRKGIVELVTSIKWSIETGIWDISKENYENRGVVNLKSF